MFAIIKQYARLGSRKTGDGRREKAASRGLLGRDDAQVGEPPAVRRVVGVVGDPRQTQLDDRSVAGHHVEVVVEPAQDVHQYRAARVADHVVERLLVVVEGDGEVVVVAALQRDAALQSRLDEGGARVDDELGLAEVLEAAEEQGLAEPAAADAEHADDVTEDHEAWRIRHRDVEVDRQLVVVDVGGEGRRDVHVRVVPRQAEEEPRPVVQGDRGAGDGDLRGRVLDARLPAVGGGEVAQGVERRVAGDGGVDARGGAGADRLQDVVYADDPLRRDRDAGALLDRRALGAQHRHLAGRRQVAGVEDLQAARRVGRLDQVPDVDRRAGPIELVGGEQRQLPGGPDGALLDLQGDLDQIEPRHR